MGERFSPLFAKQVYGGSNPSSYSVAKLVKTASFDNSINQTKMTQEVYTDHEVTPHPSELTHGEKLVGKTFNPSGDDKVAKAKALCAELADLIYLQEESSIQHGTLTRLRATLIDRALTDILAAQMMVVKTLTLQ